ncbi:MAG TPA: hypothetical protein VG738_18670 [Chitinophagaceae bacterium]|nr:hypothetical protein [Chitinophagaceae bacterium]
MLSIPFHPSEEGVDNKNLAPGAQRPYSVTGTDDYGHDEAVGQAMAKVN